MADAVLMANFFAVRSIAVEFGPAEVIDSAVIRPIALYAGPYVLGNVIVGWVVGSVLADVAFYGMAIFSYEKRTRSRNPPTSTTPMRGDPHIRRRKHL